MTFEQLIREPKHLLLKSISGSRAYNLALPASDTDIKGIFVLPQKELYGLSYTDQVANESNDETFFEVGKFIGLLCKNNPNILELISVPESCVLFRHPLMELVRPEDFLSRMCLDTFAGYAKTQIKKARGLNKKINQSFEKERKTPLDFCYMVRGNGTVSLQEWLRENGFLQAECGLVKLEHFRDSYLVYHREQAGDEVRGIVSGPLANEVQLSPVAKGIAALGIMYFNRDAYSLYCREYQEYWEWVEKRNEARYQNTLSHGKNYDSKNMMHTIRLLNMAEEIALYRRVIVYREDRDFLLRIRAGEFEYEELIDMVEEKMLKIEEAYAKSDLPDAPDARLGEKLLVRIREEFYHSSMVHAVSIEPYQPEWPARAGKVADQLAEVLGGNLIRVEHIGSTSVPGLSAKPVIDLIPIVRSLEQLDQQQHLIKALGYEWRGAFGIGGRRFCPLDSPSGERVVHLHFYQEGAANILRHLAFRDYLRAHPQIVKEYEAEKRRAALLHPADSLAYNDEKAAWVQKHEKDALEWYKNNAPAI